MIFDESNDFKSQPELHTTIFNKPLETLAQKQLKINMYETLLIQEKLLLLQLRKDTSYKESIVLYFC